VGVRRSGLGTWVAVAAAAVLLGVAAASAPFYVSSAGTAMLATELDAVSTDGLSLLSVHVSGFGDPDSIRAADRLLRDRLADGDLPAPTVQVVVDVTAETDPEQHVNVIGREGALAALPPTVEDGEGPYAVAASSAGRLGLGAGDGVPLRGGTGETTTVQVGAIVEDVDREAMPPFWRPVTGLLTAVDDPRIPPPPPALLTDADSALDLLGALGGSETDGELVRGTFATTTWDVTLADDLTLEQAEAVVPRMGSVRTWAVDPTSELGRVLAPSGSSPAVGGQQLEAALRRVEAAAAGLRVPVRMLGWAGQVLAIAVIAAATVLGGRRQLARARLWAVRGVAAPMLGLRWALAAVVPVGGGLATGWWLADVGVRSAGPGAAVDPGVRTAVWRDLVVAGAASVLVVWVVVTLVSAAAARETPGQRRVPPVAELLAVLVAGLAWWQLDTRGSAVAVDNDGVLRLDPLTVALPLLIVVAVAGVGARLLTLALQRSPGRRARPPWWYLASRRLRTIGGASVALVAITAAATGLLVVAVTLSASAETTVDEQVGVLVGADVALSLSRAETVSGGVTPDDVPLPATRVRRAPESLLDDRHLVDVLAIDPATFANVAFQPGRLGEVDVRALTDRLAAPPADGPLPAVMVGSAFPGRRALTVGSIDLEVEQVGTAPVFPGVTGARPAVVVPDGGPLAPDDAAVASRLAVSVYPELWMDADGLDPAALRLEIERVALPSSGSGPGATGPHEFVFADDLREDPGLAPARWTFRYLQGQATVIAALGVLALLAHHRSRQRQQALATALAVRMGLRGRERTLVELVELAVLLGSALLLGAGAGVIAARAVLTEYDPLPDVSLPVVFAPPLDLAPIAGLVGAALVAGTVIWSRRTTQRVDVATLLRSDG
jgi:putative ABC transport system permease protein